MNIEDDIDTLCYYDEGWNARCKGQDFNRKAKRDWQDGWRDCDEADPKERNPI